MLSCAPLPALRRHAVALYDSEVHYVDRQIGRPLEAVEAAPPEWFTSPSGRKRSTASVYDLAADPGEPDPVATPPGAERLEQRLLARVERDRPHRARPEEELTVEEAGRLRRPAYL